MASWRAWLKVGLLKGIRMTFAPLSVAHCTPAIISLSKPVLSAPRTVTGITDTPLGATPATPIPLLVVAAMMPAIMVPWPVESIKPLDPSSAPFRMDVPFITLPVRSGWVASTPESRRATVAVPVGVVTPYTLSQPVIGSAHWEA